MLLNRTSAEPLSIRSWPALCDADWTHVEIWKMATLAPELEVTHLAVLTNEEDFFETTTISVWGFAPTNDEIGIALAKAETEHRGRDWSKWMM